VSSRLDSATTHVVNYLNTDGRGMPEGTLTPAQYEILDVVWQAGEEGATVAQVWRKISESRPVTRTTILNLVDRLEKRGWLKRRDAEGGARYSAAVTRDRTSAALAGDFVQTFFDGSTANLVMSLLGTSKLNAAEIRRLREILDRAPHKSSRREGGR
jgi:predicted transcriptional regulator